MEGLPILTCLIQHTLKNICTSSSSSSSSSTSDDISTKWVYAVFWRIMPRIYPPPKWDYEGGVLDRTKGNKRNWILVWEDGYCDLDECDRSRNGFLKGTFAGDIFFKLSHEVYNYGEGLIGKVAADNSHRWVHKDGSNENDPSFMSSWNASIDPEPKAWESHFISGIKTIAIISVREGIVQLGSFDKILEDPNLVISIQRKFSYLRSIPGLLSIQRPFSTVQHTYNTLKHTNQVPGCTIGSDDQIGSNGSIRFLKSGYNGPPLWPIPPLLPSNFGSHSRKLPSYDNDPTRFDNDRTKERVTREVDPGQEEKPGYFDPDLGLVGEIGCWRTHEDFSRK